METAAIIENSDQVSNAVEPDATPTFMDLGRMLLSFLLVIGLLFGCAWWLKRWQPGLAPGLGGLQTKAVLSLGGRDRAVVIQAGDRQLLLGVSPGKIVLLGDYDQLLPDVTPDKEKNPARRFRSLLKGE